MSSNKIETEKVGYWIDGEWDMDFWHGTCSVCKNKYEIGSLAYRLSFANRDAHKTPPEYCPCGAHMVGRPSVTKGQKFAEVFGDISYTELITFRFGDIYPSEWWDAPYEAPKETN